MTAFEKKRGRVIDFEGSTSVGIQQASIIDFKNSEIINSKEYLKDDGEFSGWFAKNTENSEIEIWVAHNFTVEKNLIAQNAPYKNNLLSMSSSMQWGPWIDTLIIYKRLYPNLEKYTLSDLKLRFLDVKKIERIAQRLCKRTKPKPHQSMYDAIVTYLLLDRLRTKVDFNLFLICE